MGEKFGSDVLKWPKIGCDAKFALYRKGPSTVAEVLLGDGAWATFSAERIPHILGDAIKGHYANVFMASQKLTQRS